MLVVEGAGSLTTAVQEVKVMASATTTSANNGVNFFIPEIRSLCFRQVYDAAVKIFAAGRFVRRN